MNRALLHPRAPGRDPFEEVWFIEASLDRERALWLRYGHRRIDGVERWTVQAMALRGSEQWAHEQEYTSRPDDLGTIHPAGLGPHRARGAAGDLSWDLQLAADHGHGHVPPRLARTGLTGRAYASAALDLRLTGEISVAGERWVVDGAVGVLGHIWGHRANTRRWLWCHASHFEDHPQTQVEVLSARLGLGRLTLPWATSIIIRHGRDRWAMTRTRSLFAPVVRADSRGWSLSAQRGETTVRLHAQLPHAGSVLGLDLHHANGTGHRVQNSPIGSLRVEVDHPDWGRLALHTDRASVELAEPAS